jgi:hypothetical protein
VKISKVYDRVKGGRFLLGWNDKIEGELKIRRQREFIEARIELLRGQEVKLSDVELFKLFRVDFLPLNSTTSPNSFYTTIFTHVSFKNLARFSIISQLPLCAFDVSGLIVIETSLPSIMFVYSSIHETAKNSIFFSSFALKSIKFVATSRDDGRYQFRLHLFS